MERGSTDVHQCKPEDVLTGLLREEARAGKRWNDIGVDRKPLAELESLTEVGGCTPVERDDDPADREFLDRPLQSGVITNDRRQIGYLLAAGRGQEPDRGHPELGVTADGLDELDRGCALTDHKNALPDQSAPAGVADDGV